MVLIIISCILFHCVLTESRNGTPSPTIQPTSTITGGLNTTAVPTSTAVLAQSSQNSTSPLQTMTSTVTVNMPPPTTTESSSSALTTIHSASTTTDQLSTTIQPTSTTTGGLQTTVAPTSVLVQINSTSPLQTMTTTVTVNMPPSTTTESNSSTLTTIHSASTTTAQLSTTIQPTNTTTGGLQTTVVPTSAAGIKYNANMTLTGKSWKSDYLVANSTESKNLIIVIEEEIKKFFDSSGIIFKNFTDINFKNYSGKVQAVFAMVVSPAGGSTKHKDPLLHWKEAVEKEMIGSLAVDKELTKLREEIPPGTTVEEWKTKDGECDNCNVGPVAQERTCLGGGCSNVLRTRWVTCSEGSCIPSTGPILLSSLRLMIAALILVFFA